MQELLDAQEDIVNDINKLWTNFKKDGPDRKTQEYIKRRLDSLDHLWSTFHINHMKLLEFDDISSDYFQEDKYQATKTLYNHIRKYLSEYVVTGKKPEVQGPEAGAGTSFSVSQPNPPSHSPPIKDQGTSSKLDETLRKQISNFRAFRRTVENINIKNIRERWEFDDALKTLQVRWSIIDSLHWEIDSETNGENSEYEESFNQHERTYLNLKKEINQRMWSVIHREKSTPQMDTPIFHGNYHQWMSFKDLFMETIHNNMSIPNAQKMQFLKSKVRGEAEKLIQHLPISTDNYETCWKILNHRFDNKKLIINSHINILLSLPTMPHQAPAQIKKLHDTTKECLFAINNLGADTTNWDPLIVFILSQKLDVDTHKDYVDSLKNPRDIPVLEEFLEFLENKFISLESARRKNESPKSNINQETDKKQQQNIKSQPTSTYNNNYTPKKFINYSQKPANNINQKCPLCNIDHGLFFCNKFLSLNASNKRNMIIKHDICKNCLYKHYGKPCKSEKSCRRCGEQHNTLLHEAFSHAGDSTNNATPGTSGQNTYELTKSGSNNHVSQKVYSEVLLATAILKVQKYDGTYINMRALIDQGSQSSLITERAAQLLKLPRQKCNSVIFGVGTKENNCKGIINIRCLSMVNDYTFDTEVSIMRNLINNLPNNSFPKPLWSHLENIQLADPQFYISRPVDLLLGADVFAGIILGGVIREDNILPIAQQTRLGWILSGNVKSFQCNVIINNTDEMQRFWQVEDISEDSEISEEDQDCIKYYQETTQRNQEGRYIVRLPLKSEIYQMLGESKQKSIAQFKQLEQKFQRKENLAKQYKLFMREYLELGHMSQVSGNRTPTYYLPHHAVERAESTTTKLRVVFNASSKTNSGFSLNDLMKRGPNLQQDLFDLITKWRQYQVGLTADVEKMFRQINLNEQDQQYQRIIWRESPNEPIKEYQLTTVTYGTRAAPFLAMMTLKQLAKDEGDKYQGSQAKRALLEHFYTDDLVYGTHNADSAVQLISDLKQLLLSGGFNLRKWNSNCRQIIDYQEEDECFEFKHQETNKTLGLGWSAQNDQFNFKFNMSPLSEKITKRSLLSDVSRIFDPIGWLSPVTIKLKILFQKVWTVEGLKWDDTLPVNIYTEWLNIRQGLEGIEQIKMPRWLQGGDRENVELHGFCDSSVNAYACVIYCKINRPNQESCITMVAAKSRVVSKSKILTLPRLELCAAELLSKLMHKVSKCLPEYNIRCYGWTDSTAVLGWIQGDPVRWKTFVSNRVRKITNEMPSNTWGYVNTNHNPADCASRGITADQLKSHQLWWHGPTWLLSFKGQDKHVPTKYVTNEEIKLNKQCHATTYLPQSNIVGELISKHSNFMRLTHVLAWVLRVFVRDRFKNNFLSVQELEKAKEIIVKYVQYQEFSKDIDYLQKNKKVDSKSTLLCLTPFLDQQGLLRVGGRIKHSNININMKHPLIIPHSSHLSNILIDYAHKMTFHGGARLTLSWLRNEYWLIGGNRAVKQRLRQCGLCRRHAPEYQYQIMGDLPAARCNPSRPFYNTGVDYTGFVDIKTNKGRGVKTTKGYIAVFVCMVTKAVHLEVVSDLTSSAFLAALRRMSARRGAPRYIYSDNGTNFVGANNILQDQYLNLQSVLDAEFFTYISEMKIEWSFNAPAWPSAGGLWESAVKSLKHHLRRVLGEQKLTYEEFSTLLSQIEACLNTRPLCPISEDPDDLDYLTPAHFLSSGPVLTIIETETDERTRWRLTQKIFDDLWKRWKSEYLCQLSKRSKWRKPQESIKLNDVVIIHDANLPAGKWALGRVIQLHPGPDNYVRVVTLKTKNGTIKRPIVKLSLLPTNKVEQNKNDEEVSSDDSTHVSGSRDKKHKQLRTNIKSNCLTNILFTILTLFMIAWQPVTCYNYQISKLSNQTIFFDKVSNINLIRDEWKLVVYYDTTPYYDGFALFEKYLTYLEKSCLSMTVHKQCEISMLQLRHELNELQHYNELLLGQGFLHTRQKRGLINIVGNVAHSLFGVLDNEFAEQYQRDIELIKSNENHLSALWKNQTSIVEAQYNLMHRLQNNVDKHHKMFNQHLISLEKYTNNINKEVEGTQQYVQFLQSSFIAYSLATNLRTTQDMMLDLVTNIYEQKFNLHSINPNQLRTELSIIVGQLSELCLPIDNLQTDLHKLYHFLKVKSKVVPGYIIFEIRIPLIERDKYELYKLVGIPQRFNNNMKTIVPISEYISMNINKDLYSPLSEEDLRDCIRQEDRVLCLQRKPLYHFSSDERFCNLNQEGDCNLETSLCENKWIQLQEINSYLYSSCKDNDIRLICKNDLRTINLQNFGIIKINEGCIIKMVNLTIFAHSERSSQIRIKSDIPLSIQIPPINNIIKMPSLATESSNISIENTTEIEVDFKILKQKIESIKAEPALYQSVSYHDIHHYVAIYIVISIVSCVAAVWLWRRWRSRHSAPAAAAAPPLAAREVPIEMGNSATLQQPAIPSAVYSASSDYTKPKIVQYHFKNQLVNATSAKANLSSASVLNKSTSPERKPFRDYKFN